ncbi:MAG: hypothetical protein J6X97_07080 [Lachnospiraceae bacterium]|nr:hypothetical protein [Lachnospiraceae bacterium]
MDKKEKKNNKKTKLIILDCIFLAVLVLLPFLHLAFGVEFTDTAYSLGNYENLDKMNLTWTVATFWANMLGRFFTMLPFGATWIGMKFYTTLVPVTGVVFSYLFLKKYIPRLFVFVGEILAISLFWCPTTILYNYVTYLLFTLAVIVLVESLSKDKRWGLAFAGIILAFNVFVRFPNVTEAALIVVVWFSAGLKKKKFVYGLVDTLICIGGFFAGIVANVGLIGIKYGFSSIPNMVISLFSMTGENAGYTPTGMIMAIIRGYTTYYKSFILLIGITVLCFAVSAIMKRHYARIITVVAQFILYGLFLFWGYRNHVYTLRYNDYSSIYFWMAVFFMIANIMSVWTMLRKRNDIEHKLIATAVLVIVWISPLGSNNALYPSINNLFIVAPAVLFMIWNELFKGRNFYEVLDLEARNTMVATRISMFLLIVTITIQCIIFGFVFVFRDPGFPTKNSTKIDGNEVLVGMHTNPERAALIEELTSYVNDKDYEGRRAIFYGDIPGLEYILKMPCAISHTWPNLGSFSYDDFVKDIDSLEDKPIIFINTDYMADAYNINKSYRKEQYLEDFLEKNGYSLSAKIEYIAIYSAD